MWLPGFDHRPNGPDVDPASDSVLNPSRWITQNLPASQQVTPGNRMNTVHCCLIPAGLHRGEVLVWDGNLTQYGTRAYQPWSIVNPYWPAPNPNLWPGQASQQNQYRFHNATIAMPAGMGELFCAGQAWLADGRLFVAGGTKQYPIQTNTNGWTQGVWEGTRLVYQWDHAAQPGYPFGRWYRMADLEMDRWYPTVTYDGTAAHRAIVIGGTSMVPGSNPPTMAMINSYEVARPNFNAPTPSLPVSPNDFDRKFAPAAPTWGTPPIPPATSDRQYWGPVFNGWHGFGDYPRTHVLGFLDPISAQGGGTAPRMFVSGFLTWGIRWAHDKTTDAAFSVAQGFDLGQMPGASFDWAARYATSLLMPAPIGGIGNQVVRIGGERIGVTNFASNLVETVNVQTSPSTWQTGAMPNMAEERFYANVVMLPNGNLFAVGGQKGPPGQEVYQLVPELFDGVSWKPMAPHVAPRDYHSTAILLPDARVFVCGGENRSVGGGTDYQIWEPPYFHYAYGSEPPTGIKVQDATTGTIVLETQIPGMAYNHDYRVTWDTGVEPGITVQQVVLVRPMALTHHDDGGQRLVRLLAWDDGEAVPGTVGNLVFRSPASVRHAPLGWWMLFVVTSSGRPSLAYWVNLG